MQGRIVANEWVADSIEPSPEDGEQFEFTGVIDVIGEESWQISGVSVLVNEVTELDGDLAKGDAVKVTYTILENDRWLALKIERLEPEDESTPEPTDTPAGTLTPPATVVNCTGNERQPKAESLAQEYGVSYEEIMSWFCQGFGFGEIDLAYGLSRDTGHTVADIFAMRKSGLGWGEIKRRVLLTPTATVIISPTATATVTLTPTITATPPLTVTVTPTFTVTPTPTPTPLVTLDPHARHRLHGRQPAAERPEIIRALRCALRRDHGLVLPGLWFWRDRPGLQPERARPARRWIRSSP